MAPTLELVLLGIAAAGFASYFLARRSSAHKKLWTALAITLLIIAIVAAIFVPNFHLVQPHLLP
jgi:formate-dependent nitrite reductase membrane component NrfD